MLKNQSQVNHWPGRAPRCFLPAMNADANIIDAGIRRFDRIAVTCVFGDPRNPRSWSGAPANLSNALEKLGVVVEGIHPRMSRLAKLGVTSVYMLTGLGKPPTSEHIMRLLLS